MNLMSKTELWKKLDRKEEIPNTLGYDQIIQNKDQLILIYLSEDNKKRIKIVFNERVYSFKSSIESVYVRTQLSFNKDSIENLFADNNWLFELENSRYLRWIKEEGEGLFEYDSLRHFMFYTFINVVEVLCCFPPQIIVEEM